MMIIQKIFRKQHSLVKDGCSRLKPWILRLFVFVCTVIALELCVQMRYLRVTTSTYIDYFKNDRPELPRAPADNFSFVDDLLLQFQTSFVTVDGTACFKNGLSNDVIISNVTTTGCRCKPRWYGQSCSIPSEVFHSTTPWNMSADLTLRFRPRRIVQAFPFNMEFEMLELRFAELASVVDVFLILESTYTAFGTTKPLYLLDRLTDGMYANVSNKIVHVTLDYFPAGARTNGWIADGLHRDYIGTHGLSKISGLNLSDIFILTDADELPKSEVLSFLKWHDGYTEPIAIAYQWTVFGFFWSPASSAPEPVETEREIWIPQTQQTLAVTTIGMVRYVFRNMVYGIRAAGKVVQKNPSLVTIYSKIGGRVSQWTIGSDSMMAGWHCSWCMGVNRIRNKLLSAQNGDFPRWGSFPGKTNPSFIRKLIARGMWFDELSTFRKVNVSGPESLYQNKSRFRHIIYNPYT